MACAGAALTSCEPPNQDEPVVLEEPIPTDASVLPSEATLEVVPNVLDENRVEFSIETSLPLPVTVNTSIGLKGQAPEDTYIGYNGGRVELKNQRTVVVLDTSQASMPLPSGAYNAEVSFFPAWGAEGNPLAASAPELRDSVEISLVGTGGTVESARRRDELRGWIMEKVYSNSPWNQKQMEQKLGSSEQLVADRSHALDAFYFPDADATMIVNRSRSTVLIWRFGRATS